MRKFGILALSTLCLLSLLGAVLAYSGFDGIVISGLKTEIGSVRMGRRFEQRMRLFNLSPNAVNVTLRPTCGCAFLGAKDSIVEPFSSCDLVVPYRVIKSVPGRTSRHVIIDYVSGNNRNRMVGIVSFNLTQP